MFSTVSSFNSFMFITAVISLPHNIWSPLGDTTYNGTNGIINCTTYDPSNSVFYVGGSFTQVYDSVNLSLTVGNIAQWNIATNTWSIIGGNATNNGVNRPVFNITLDSSNTSIYIGGPFTSTNTSIAANHIIKWNLKTSSWGYFGNATANGVDGNVSAMSLDPINKLLYVGGRFTTAYDTSNTDGLGASNIVKWNFLNNTWNLLGNVESNGFTINGSGFVNSLVLDASNNALYVAANFSGLFDAYNVWYDAYQYLVKWNTTSNRWSTLDNTKFTGIMGPGYTGSVNSLALDSSNGLYVGGLINAVFVKNIGIINITTNLTNTNSLYIDGTVYCSVVDSSKNWIYIGGSFLTVYDATNVNGLSANNIAKLNITGNYWEVIGNTTSNGVKNNQFGGGSITSMVLDSTRNSLYVGGSFKYTYDEINGSKTVGNVAIWYTTGNCWNYVGDAASNGTNTTVNTMAFDSKNNLVYMGLSPIYYLQTPKVFDPSNSTGMLVNQIAAWNITGNYWSLLGIPSANGADDAVTALALDSNNNLYVGGMFQHVYDSTNSSGIGAAGIAKWNSSGNIWSLLGINGHNGIYPAAVRSIAIDNVNNRVYVGGSFTETHDAINYSLNANCIAIWNSTGNYWSRLGTSSSNGAPTTRGDTVISMLLDTSLNLLICGCFDSVFDGSNISGLPVNNIAKWNFTGNYWSSVGNGLNSIVNTIASYSSTSYFLGENILNSVGNIIKWNITSNYWSFLGSFNSNGLNNSVSNNSLIMDISNNRLYVGGIFTKAFDKANAGRSTENFQVAGGVYVGKVAYFDTVNQVWNKLGGGSAGTGVKFSNNSTSYANSLGLDTSNNALYVGGTFDTAYNSSAISANNIAKWNV